MMTADCVPVQKAKKDKKGGKKSKSKGAAVVAEEVPEPAEAGGGAELLDLDMGTKPVEVRLPEGVVMLMQCSSYHSQFLISSF